METEGFKKRFFPNCFIRKKKNKGRRGTQDPEKRAKNFQNFTERKGKGKVGNGKWEPAPKGKSWFFIQFFWGFFFGGFGGGGGVFWGGFFFGFFLCCFFLGERKKKQRPLLTRGGLFCHCKEKTRNHQGLHIYILGGKPFQGVSSFRIREKSRYKKRRGGGGGQGYKPALPQRENFRN